MLEAYSVPRLLEQREAEYSDETEGENQLTDQADSQAEKKDDDDLAHLLNFGAKEQPKPHEIRLLSVAKWGSRGFIVGGTGGFIGLLRHTTTEKLELASVIWASSSFDQDVCYISHWKEWCLPA